MTDGLRRGMLRQGWRLAGAAAWGAAWLGAGAGWSGLAQAGAAAPGVSVRLATAWQRVGADGRPGAWQAAVLALDEAAPQLELLQAVDLPTRAHGLHPLPDGGVLVVANRPGRWLLRLGPGAQRQLHRLPDAGEVRTLNGHVLTAPDGERLWTSETDPRDGRGWIGVRDARTLALLASWPLDDGSGPEGQGIDPHQMVCDAHGDLLVAVGGIARWGDGRPREGEPMNPGLWRLDGREGRVSGRWQLADRALSVRHLAWSQEPVPRLGLALQAEHARAEDRQAAPLLALFDGQRLQAVDALAPRQAVGYAGDIAAAPGGGFVLSAQKAGRALWWDPATAAQAPADGSTATPGLRPVAELTETCALAWLASASAPARTVGDGVLIGAARGLGLWRRQGPSRLLPWPVAVLPDNHLVRLADA